MDLEIPTINLDDIDLNFNIDDIEPLDLSDIDTNIDFSNIDINIEEMLKEAIDTIDNYKLDLGVEDLDVWERKLLY